MMSGVKGGVVSCFAQRSRHAPLVQPNTGLRGEGCLLWAMALSVPVVTDKAASEPRPSSSLVQDQRL